MAGKLVHFELPAEDTSRAVGFWGDLFGWEFTSWEGPVEYRMTPAGGDPGGAIYARQEGSGGVLAYFDTDDIDASVARVRELGGEAGDKAPIPGVGWFSHCKDTEGNRFGLFLTDESVQGHE